MLAKQKQYSVQPNRTNTFSIQKYPSMHMGGHSSWRKYHNRQHVTLEQYKKLKNLAKLPVLLSVSTSAFGKPVKYRDKQAKNFPEIYAGDEGTVRVYNTYIEDGRNITPEDIHLKKRVALIGGDVVDQLFPFEDPLNKTISIDGINFQENSDLLQPPQYKPSVFRSITCPYHVP